VVAAFSAHYGVRSVLISGISLRATMANTIKETTAKLVEAGTAVRAELYAQSQTLDSANLATVMGPGQR
jgi:hypothetical protein